jgi:hypothetical protein
MYRIQQDLVSHLKWSPSAKADEFWTVLRIYCHVISSASQLHSLVVRSVSVCAPPTGISDRHERLWPSFGRFCAFTVTWSRQPVSSTRLLFALSLSARHSQSFVPVSTTAGSNKPCELSIQDGQDRGYRNYTETQYLLVMQMSCLKRYET